MILIVQLLPKLLRKSIEIHSAVPEKNTSSTSCFTYNFENVVAAYKIRFPDPSSSANAGNQSKRSPVSGMMSPSTSALSSPASSKDVFGLSLHYKRRKKS